MENPYHPPTGTKTSEVNGGKVLVFCVVAFTLVTTIVSISRSRVEVTDLIRYALTFALIVALYKGHTWARYTLAILFAIAAIMTLVIIFNAANLLDKLYMAFEFCGNTASFIILTCVPSIRQFLAKQRRASSRRLVG